MRTYDTYKDSGISWLGQIPSHWDVRRTKTIWEEHVSLSETGTEQLLSVSQYDGVKPNDEGSRSESLVGYKVVDSSNLVINIMLAWLGGLGVSQNKGIVSPAYCVYKLKENHCPEYFHYLYRTAMYLAEFARKSTGVVPSRWRMYTDSFGIVLSIVPPRDEQEAIVAYLDNATAEIDKAIASQQRMVELLQERKQIIINQAVSQGLNPDALMKPTNIDWLPQIPAHWQLRRFKYIGKTSKVLINPNLFKDLLFYEYSMPAFDNQKQPDVVLGKNMESSKVVLSESTLLVNKLNVHKKRIWYVNNPEENSVASTEFIPFAIREANPYFVELFLKSDQVTDYLNNNTNGATNSQKRVAPDTIYNLLIALPPQEEQHKIVQAVERQINPIEESISRCEQKIALLTERKQILINDVVTGKIKVI